MERLDGLQHMRIPAGQRYVSPGAAYVEGDASSASYFLAGATITGGTVTVEGCGSESLQGDVRFAEVMGLMGATVEWAPYSITLTGPSVGLLLGKVSGLRALARALMEVQSALGPLPRHSHRYIFWVLECALEPGERSLGGWRRVRFPSRRRHGSVPRTRACGGGRPDSRAAEGHRP